VKRSVLIIVENLPVPFDTRVWKEAIALHKADYEVSVLCPKGKGHEKGYELLEGIHIYRHPMPREGNSPLGYVWEYGCALFWEFFYSWWIYLRRGFQVIQGCNPPDDIFLVALPFKLLGVKYIFEGKTSFIRHRSGWNNSRSAVAMWSCRPTIVTRTSR
jgi:hypothetical protein